MSGGASAIRGFLLQTLVALLESLELERTLHQSVPWNSLEIEPVLDDTEKIDILWMMEDGTGRAVQVKSTTNSFSVPEIEDWANSLLKWKHRASQMRYELCLLGMPANTKAANKKSVKLKEKEPPHLNLLVNSGSGRFPS